MPGDGPPAFGAERTEVLVRVAPPAPFPIEDGNRSPVVDETAPGARGAVAEHGPGAFRYVALELAHRPLQHRLRIADRLESSAKPVDTPGRQVARRRIQKAEARVRRGDSVQLCELPAQLRCELGVLHPATIDGRTRTAILVSLRLQTRIQRHRLYCCAPSIPTSVTNPVRFSSRRRRLFGISGTAPGASREPPPVLRLPDEVGDEEGGAEHAGVLAQHERPGDVNAGVVRRAQQRELLAPGSTVLPSERNLAPHHPEIPAGLLAAAGRRHDCPGLSSTAAPQLLRRLDANRLPERPGQPGLQTLRRVAIQRSASLAGVSDRG